MKTEWILVADASEARLLQQEHGGPLRQLQAFRHPESRRHSSELGADQRGRAARDGRSGAVAFAPRVEPHRKEHLRFARELAEALEEGCRQERCAAVRVFAASPFLGELKSVLGDATLARLAGAHDADLTALDLGALERHLQDGAPAR